MVGALLGGAAAWAGSRALVAVVPGIGSVFDRSVFEGSALAAAPLLLVGLALAACYWPARRALAMDPALALREE